MKLLNKLSVHGQSFAEEVGRKIIEDMRKNPALKESAILKEDNTMASGAAFYTTKLAQFIYYKSYNDFKAYFDFVWNLTPADLGMPDGAGVYQIPKVLAGTAKKLSEGEVLDYLNDKNGFVSLTTDTYGIGTRISRRAIKRYAKGVMEKLMQSASDAVLRGVCTDLVNGLVAGADSNNNVTGNISYNKVEEAKEKIYTATDANGILLGLTPKSIGFTATGWRFYSQDADVKNAVAMGQRNVPGDQLRNDYLVIQELKVVRLPLISVQKNAKAVHALVADNDHFGVFLNETQMETYDGRIPGTAGDMEIIHAMDAGFAILNAEAGSVITAA